MAVATTLEQGKMSQELRDDYSAALQALGGVKNRNSGEFGGAEELCGASETTVLRWDRTSVGM